MRMIAKDVCITRPEASKALYKMSNHSESLKNPVRETLLFSSIKRMNEDGLSNLNKLNLSIVDAKSYALYTHLRIDVGKRMPDYYQKYNKSRAYFDALQKINH